MVLLVVGLNISGMMLVRSAMRERELAIRLAIGASRWRLMQYHLSEALVMAVLGGSLASALLFGGPGGRAWAYDFYGPELDLFKPDAWLVLQCIALCFVTSACWGCCRRFASAGRRSWRHSRTTPPAAAGASAACSGSRRQRKPVSPSRFSSLVASSSIRRV